MNILVNVTNSLKGDYNELVSYLSHSVAGDKYFAVSESIDVMDTSELDNYDIIVNFIDDDTDNEAEFHRLLDYAKAKNRVDRFVVYYKSKPYYTNEKVYYIKKDANHNREYRFLDYVDTDEVVFDFMAYAKYKFGADINIKNGMLRFKDYDILDMGAVRFLANNDLINKYYKELLVAREEEQLLAEEAKIDDKKSLEHIEEVHYHMDKIYLDLDRLLEYALCLYIEVLHSFENSEIFILDYLYTKEYFEIGHFTSITNCFNRNVYRDITEREDAKVEDVLSILKLVVYSMAFAPTNEFVVDTLKRIFDVGKAYELKHGKDLFFYVNAHNFEARIGEADSALGEYKNYLKLVESDVLEGNRENMYKAYSTLVAYHVDRGEYTDALPYALKMIKVANRDIDVVKCAHQLFRLYRVLADSVNELKYIDIIKSKVDLMNDGYHSDYAAIAIEIMNINDEDTRDIVWQTKVIDYALANKFMDNNSYYFLYMKKMFTGENGIGVDERLEGLKYIVKEMIDNFYQEPTTMYVGIYNTLVVLAGLYEEKGDDLNAAVCYKRATTYLGMLEDVDEDIDIDLAYVQYRIGYIAMDMASQKSYRQLAKADRRLTQHIKKTGEYAEFYSELLIAIADRYFLDNRVLAAKVVAKNNLNKLVDFATMNSEYIRDVVTYSEHMASMLSKHPKDRVEYERYVKNYRQLAKEKNIKID